MSHEPASGAPGILRALISVWDKSGIVDFARALHDEFKIEIISTGGTAKTLRDAGIPATLVEDITGCGEMLDGRVKTLHPAIHAAILADRDNPEHMRQLEAAGIQPIDMVVVNLYPFERTIADPNCTFEQAIEMIDVGGVALLRAAAKNHRHVVVLSHWDMYIAKRKAWELANFRREMAEWALRTTAAYDAAIASYLAGGRAGFDRLSTVRLAEPRVLRYGENPHGRAAAYEYACYYEPDPLTGELKRRMTLLGPTEGSLSFNNYLDADAALGLCSELARAKTQAAWHRHLRHRFSTGESLHGSPTHARRRVAPRITEEQWTERNLPHLQVPGATYFVTFRLRSGQLSPAERDIVLSACTFWHAQKVTVHCASVMPDHVHMLVTPHELSADRWASLGELLHSIKWHSALEINRLRGASGSLWMDESFDRIMRNEKEFIESWQYIEANPVAAGLVQALPYRWFWRSDAEFGECILERAEEPPGMEAQAQAHRLETGATGRSTVGHRLKTGASDAGATRTGAADAGVAAVHVCVFIKHTNACGAAVHADPVEAYRRAYLGDPNAAMGGILAVDFTVDAGFAAVVMETYARFGKPLKDAGATNAPSGFFVEVWIAPRFTRDALALIRGTYDPATATPEANEPRLGTAGAPPAPKKDWGQRVRLLAVGDMTAPRDPNELVYRSIAGGMLVQSPDLPGLDEEQWKVVTRRAPTDGEMADLRLAWLICKHTRSNAISICRDGMLVGNGAGQMSRVMSCRVATWLARENGHMPRSVDESAPAGPAQDGPVAASDAFFPFTDGPLSLIGAGVTALIQPGGSKRDEEVIAACDARGVAMIFSGTRHFRH